MGFPESTVLTAFWKVFGVAPPQTLYHTRKSDSPTPQSPRQAPVLSTDIDISPAAAPLDPFSFFTMQGFGGKGKKLRRSATSDSSRALISRSEPSSSIEIYTSYHDSLNSLIEIVHNVRLSLFEMLIMQLRLLFHRRTTRPHSK